MFCNKRQHIKYQYSCIALPFYFTSNPNRSFRDGDNFFSFRFEHPFQTQFTSNGKKNYLNVIILSPITIGILPQQASKLIRSGPNRITPSIYTNYLAKHLRHCMTN